MKIQIAMASFALAFGSLAFAKTDTLIVADCLASSNIGITQGYPNQFMQLFDDQVEVIECYNAQNGYQLSVAAQTDMRNACRSITGQPRAANVRCLTLGIQIAKAAGRCPRSRSSQTILRARASATE